MTSSFRTNSFAAGILFGVVALSPLPMGSTGPLWIALWCGVFGIAAITLSFRYTRAAHVRLLLCLGLLPLAYMVVLHEQLSLHPWFSGAFPSVWWGRASAALGEPLAGTRSIIREQPWYSLGPALLVCLVAACSVFVCADRVWANRLLNWVPWVGAVYAVFGIAQFLVDPTRVVTVEKYAYRDVLTATFVNRNTAAVYFGCCLILTLLKAAKAVERRLENRGSISFRALRSVGVPRAAVVPFALSGLFLVAMLMTASRAGIVLSIACAVAAIPLVFKSQLSKRMMVVAMIAAGAVFSGLLIVFGGAVTGRFGSQGFSDGGRAEIYAAALGMLRDNPVFGTGLGTFRWAFSPYRPDDLPAWGIWDRAHNTLLEIAVEMGVPLALLVLAGMLLIVAILVRGVATRRTDRMVSIAGLAVAILSFAHTLIDFSLQIPGYSVTAFAVMGAGLAQSFRAEKGSISA